MSLVTNQAFMTAVITPSGSAGAVSVPGLQVGDRVILQVSSVDGRIGNYESVISVADEVQQLAGWGDGGTVTLTILRLN
jgi:hypothetical protein